MAPWEPTAVSPTAASGEALRAGGTAHSNGNHIDRWQELYESATPEQRGQILALARQQGLVYSYQVPVTSNGHKPREDVHLAELTRLLEGKPELPPFAPEVIRPADEALDPLQREAVARALATPDICLIAGAPGTGKSRVLAEILTQAAMRGQRVLFLARRPAAVDQVLEQVARRDAVFAVRCLEAGERPESLAAPVRPLLFGERVHKLRAALPEAVRTREEAEERCRSRRREEPLWPVLGELAETAQKLLGQRADLKERRTRIPEDVTKETSALHDPGLEELAGGFATELRDERRRHQDSLAEFDAAVAKVQQARTENLARLADLESAAGKLRPLVAARLARRFWSPAWWRALLRGDVAAALRTAEQQAADIQAALASASEEMDCLQQKRRQIEEEHQGSIAQLAGLEMQRRRENLAEQDAVLQKEWDLLQANWRDLVERLKPETRPEAQTPAAVAEARVRWQHACHEDDEDCRFAAQWASYLHESMDFLPTRLPGLVNLVAGTLPGLTADKHFSHGQADFDLLVLDDAEQVNEAEFLKMARRARRWVLVGNAGSEKPAPAPVKNGRAGGVTGLNARHKLDGPPTAAVGPASFFQRLYRLQRAELRGSRQAWGREQDRLCCRLRNVDSDQRRHLECERVADFPEIELRILTLPGGGPVLAEVVFPPSMSLGQAKEYIYREIQELPLETAANTLCLVEGTASIAVQLAGAAEQPVTVIALADGLRELISPHPTHPSGWHTCGLEFDKSAGWDRERVQSWLQQHWGLQDAGRTVFLHTAYRRNVPDRPPAGLARGPGRLFVGS